MLPLVAALALLTPASSVYSTTTIATSSVAQVPYYSQFADITSPSWQKRGCGIASLAMVIGYYTGRDVSVDTLLAQGIKAGAYSPQGWTYKGLIGVAAGYGLGGESYDLAAQGHSAALKQLQQNLNDGPVIASVHYKFDPKNPIPHLVVVDGIKNNLVYYNDPATKGADKTIALDTFVQAWKMRFIVLRPSANKRLEA